MQTVPSDGQLGATSGPNLQLLHVIAKFIEIIEITQVMEVTQYIPTQGSVRIQSKSSRNISHPAFAGIPSASVGWMLAGFDNVHTAH